MAREMGDQMTAAVEPGVGAGLERRGRRWLLWSFLACPCHLPLTLALLGGVFGGTVIGALLREHTVVAGVVITATWVAGTARGLFLVRKADRGELACALPQPGRRRWLPGRR